MVLKMNLIRLLHLLMLLYPASASDWRILSSFALDHVSAEQGMVYASGPDGIFQKHDATAVGALDRFFAQQPQPQYVWISPQRSCRTNATQFVYAIANHTLFATTDYTNWSKVFPDKNHKEIVTIHGNGIITVFIEATPKLNLLDRSKTFRGTVYVATTDNLTIAEAKATFPISRAYVSPQGHIITYGDIHGPYAPTIGYSSDGGNSWIHSLGSTGMRRGSIASDDNILFIASESGYLMKSYDRGRSFTHLTSRNGLPSSIAINDILLVNGVLYVATQGEGLLVSPDGGFSFPYRATQGNRNFPSNNVKALAFDKCTDSLYAVTDGGLVVKTNVSEPRMDQPEAQSWMKKLWGSHPLSTF